MRFLDFNVVMRSHAFNRPHDAHTRVCTGERLQAGACTCLRCLMLSTCAHRKHRVHTCSPSLFDLIAGTCAHEKHVCTRARAHPFVDGILPTRVHTCVCTMPYARYAHMCLFDLIAGTWAHAKSRVRTSLLDLTRSHCGHVRTQDSPRTHVPRRVDPNA